MSASERRWSRRSSTRRAHASTGRGLLGLVLWLYVETVGGIVHENVQLLIMRHQSIVRAVLVAVGVLLIPLWGTLYDDDWNWHWSAFVRWGVFVFICALTYQLVVQNTSNKAYQFAMGLAVATACVLIMANFVLAVGDEEASLANFTYFGVVVVGLIGAVIARLRAGGMALALVGTAIAQLLVPFIAPVFKQANVAPGEAVPVIGLNGVFAVLFAISALLFRRAAQTRKVAQTQEE